MGPLDLVSHNLCVYVNPIEDPKKAYFSRVIGVYFLSFINEHHVVYNHTLSHKYNVVNYLVLGDLEIASQ